MQRRLSVPSLWAALVAAAGVSACDGAGGSAPGKGSRLTELPDGRVCSQETLYLDSDGDGFGLQEDAERMCIGPGDDVPGYSRSSGDCAPDDPAVGPAADEICGDHLDENCTDADEACPESVSAQLEIPEWDCVGEPPDNVIAWALFDQVNQYYAPGACFVFFEGMPHEFYVMPVNLVPVPERAARGYMGKCETVEGCICPSIDNWAYDHGRLYALTLEGDPADCDEIVVFEHGGDEQTVSNACRKFLFQIWYNPNDYSFVAGSEAELRRRLERFNQVEIACFEGQPYDDLPFASLLTTPIRFNDAFVAR